MYIFILTPGRPTGEILVEPTDGRGDQSNPHAPTVNDMISVQCHVHNYAMCHEPYLGKANPGCHAMLIA